MSRIDLPDMICGKKKRDSGLGARCSLANPPKNFNSKGMPDPLQPIQRTRSIVSWWMDFLSVKDLAVRLYPRVSRHSARHSQPRISLTSIARLPPSLSNQPSLQSNIKEVAMNCNLKPKMWK